MRTVFTNKEDMEWCHSDNANHCHTIILFPHFEVNRQRMKWQENRNELKAGIIFSFIEQKKNKFASNVLVLQQLKPHWVPECVRQFQWTLILLEICVCVFTQTRRFVFFMDSIVWSVVFYRHQPLVRAARWECLLSVSRSGGNDDEC